MVGKGERKANRRGGGKEKVLWLSKEQPKECLLAPFPRRNSCFCVQFHTTLYTTTHHRPCTFRYRYFIGMQQQLGTIMALFILIIAATTKPPQSPPFSLSPQGFLWGLARVAGGKLCSIPLFLSFLLSLLLSALSFVRDFMGSAGFFFLFSLLFSFFPSFQNS